MRPASARSSSLARHARRLRDCVQEKERTRIPASRDRRKCLQEPKTRSAFLGIFTVAHEERAPSRMAAAVRSAPLYAQAGGRRFASPAIRSLMHRRAAELGGLALGLLGLALLVALASYNPSDPSLNTATARSATNLAGPVGAALADLLLQGFGVAGALPGLAMLAWAWRIASRRGLGSMAARLAVTGTAMPALAAALEAVPRLRSVAWPTLAGPGGAIGRVLAPAVLEA